MQKELKRQLSIAITDDLREKLEAASEAADRSIAEEIRIRLEGSFRGDQHTHTMAGAVARMAAGVERETGTAWHKHAGSWQAFAEALVSRLALFGKPSGTTKFGARPHQSIPEDDPEFIGRWIAVKDYENPDWTNSPERAAMEQGYRQMRELKEKKS